MDDSLPGWKNLAHPCGVTHAAKALKNLPYLLSPREWEDCFAIYKQCREMIKGVGPAIVVEFAR